MAIIAVFGELQDFNGQTNTTFSTTAGTYDPIYARGSMRMEASGGASTVTFADQNDIYVRVSWYTNLTPSAASGRTVFGIGKTDQSLIGRLVTSSSGILAFQRWDGSSYQNITTFSQDSSSLTTWVMRVNITVSGVLSFWSNGTHIGTYSGDLSSYGSSVDQVVFGTTGTPSNTYNHVSEGIIATHDVRQARLATVNLTGAGSNSAWSGAVTDINGAATLDTTFISTPTANQKATYAAADLPTDSLVVSALAVNGRMRKGLSGPANVNALVRVGGADYGTAFPAPTTTIKTQTAVFATNPATAAIWTKAEVNAAEIGVQSVI
jgi:hypothetical protein